ncbi:hypothetical protein [Acinetobacter nosocomialis]|uniref:hypothetical protein n=1 Tax=Acinetobacter nosocomialis TaxID=106654 RepID=UPI001B8436ED|nr:hypothetical protein [Acinetobacter nosocomialis]MBR7685916.1 hypothetical protein [Acinetobacter nosocomialis]MBR7700289.1 hypothetical protein [Acinetobacter nosocomialis]MBR7759137.1 hypothetical protein [Acinetobacter nosocomialis]MCE5995648.1 hypothetical protein [Acinetobacter nosocomialis]
MHLGTLFDIELYSPITAENVSNLVKAKRIKSKYLSENNGISIYRASQITQDELIEFCKSLSLENSERLLALVEREQTIVKSEYEDNINKINARIDKTEVELMENTIKENIEYSYIWWVVGLILIFVFIGFLVF